MENRIKHSFNSGDLIALMSSLKNLYEETKIKVTIFQFIDFPAFYFEGAVHPIVNKENQMVCCNEDMFGRLKPLVENQEYIQSFERWMGQEVDYNIDETRDRRYIPLPYGDMHSWNCALFPKFQTDLSKDWISIDELANHFWSDKIIINRTERYTNPYISYFFLKPYENNIIFSGTEKEHKLFCEQWKLDLEYLRTENFYELARIIKACKFGVYNQSLHFHIAQAMHLPRILELCPQFPNTFIHGADGYGFYYQKSLEYYFEKLINK